MTSAQLSDVLSRLGSVRCGVVGDFALDVYVDYSDDSDEHSVETGKLIHHGQDIRCAPGGAGNVAKNLAALEPAAIHAFGLVGDDIYGRELVRCLDQLGVDTSAMLVQYLDWHTSTYVKPLLDRIEQNRLDFGARNCPTSDSIEALVNRLEAAVASLDVLIINQQMLAPLMTVNFAEQLASLAARNPALLIIADCRDVSLLRPGVMAKVNTTEVARLLGYSVDERDTEQCLTACREASERLDGPVMMTRGENGLIVVADDQLANVPAVAVVGETDTVGAGDTCLAAYALATAAGAGAVASAEFANLAASITVTKLNQTGTANADELAAQVIDARYIYAPEIASGLRSPDMLAGTAIERITGRTSGAITHAVFDHDGTISTLRRGWNEVMYDMGLNVISGGRLAELPPGQRARLTEKIHKMVDETTGIQTIRQMMFLADIASSEGLVEASAVCTASEYKRQYLEQLMTTVNARMASVRDGSQPVTEFTVPGAVALLKQFHAAGVELILASGTDQDDVEKEATLLGYVGCFSSIHGSQGNEIGDAKRLVMQRLLAGRQTLAGIVVFGDGSVEIAEGCHAGAVTVGIANDEDIPGKLCNDKRRRLIRAGADWIVPDLTDATQLIEAIHGD